MARVGGLRGKGVVTLLAAPFRLVARDRRRHCDALRRHRPAVVLGAGGFASGPGGIAAWLLRRPLVVHEQNAVAGLTNRVLARLADRVLEGFPGSFGQRIRAERVGNPVRPEIAAIAAPEQRYAGREGRARLLVFGGSQGSARLNAVVPAAIAELPGTLRPDVLHQTGIAGLEETTAAYRSRGLDADVRAFIDDMAGAYGWADLAVCRSGALTVAELAAAGVPAILVPFPAAVDDHQTRNAELRGRGGRRGADAGSRRSRRSRSPRSCASCSRPGDRGCSRWRRPRGAPRSSTPTSGSRMPASRWREARREGRRMKDRMRRINTIHFVGIGGSGMSGIAEVLANLGYAVQGSDLKASDATRRLESLGVAVVLWATSAENVAGADVVVVSSAIDAEQPRGRVRARAAHPGRQARRDARRADALPVLDRGRRHARQDHDHEPGRERARRRWRGSDLRDRRAPEERAMRTRGSAPGDYLVAEADESDASFMHLQPMIAVVTNVDADHLGTHGGDFEKLKASFVEFLHNLPFYGLAVICSDDASHREPDTARSARPYLGYGFGADADVRAVNVERRGARSQLRRDPPGRRASRCRSR